MDYQQFILEVKEKVEQILGDGLNIEIHTTLKNNGQERIGLTISDQQINISPTIYLEEYYEHYISEHTISSIASDIAELYHEVKFEHAWPVQIIQDFTLVKPKIAYRLINAERNKELLSTLPHKIYLNLAVVFYILFEADAYGTATVPVTYELLRLWDTDVEEIYAIAHENMPLLLPAEFKPMRIVLCELLGKDPAEISIDNPMYVLTNQMRAFGASCILYDQLLKQIGEHFGENFFIIPSSIHEMMLIPESKSPLKADLNAMLVEINETQVSAEEVLSDNVYYYIRGTGIFC